MKIILKKNIDKLGNKFDVVTVKDGYARNYLLPNGFAVTASAANVKRIEEEKRKQVILKDDEKQEISKFAQKLSGLACNVKVEATEKDIVYGSVTEEDISRALEEEGFKIDKKNIILDEPIKKLGIYDIQIQLHPEVKAMIKVWVVKR